MLLLVTGLVAVAAMACAPKPERPHPRGEGIHEFAERERQRLAIDRAVLEAPDVESFLANTRDLVVIDVRDDQAYALGHVRGAISVPGAQWHKLSHAADTGLENETFWEQHLGSLGITRGSTVLVYDQGVMTEASRVWFILQHFGVADASVINGGFPMIQEAGHVWTTPVITTDASVPTPRTFAVTTNAPPRTPTTTLVGFTDRAALRKAIASGEVQVLDARTAGEFAGTDARGNPRAGHLPGGKNLPHTQLLDERGRLRQSSELATIFEQAGFRRGTTIIAHCQSGGRSSLAALAAARAGYGPVTNYYLSFGDWSRDASCPVETASAR
jgi:thiosulfate/3-mercaptopyruvate sulfurtransferase